MTEKHLDPGILKEFKEKKIHKELTFKILDGFNSGKYRNTPAVSVSSIPDMSNNSIVDRAGLKTYSMPAVAFRKRMASLLPEINSSNFGAETSGKIILSLPELEKIGVLLYPLTSFGILNGGSATSYVDRKKNQNFDPDIFNLYEDLFDTLSKESKGKAKGITPAFIQSDGEPGPDFLELKLRGLLVQALKYQVVTGKIPKDRGLSPLFPFFQMTSTYNNSQILEKLDTYNESPYLADLVEATGIPITKAETAVQPLISAFTPVEAGKELDLFTTAWGKKDTLLPLPGGHGQNFFVLRGIYKNLYKMGKRFVYIGNIDNIGSTVDPVSLAILALSGKQAAFDFSFKTPVDVKGGILVSDSSGRLNCADIGPAIPKDEVVRYEEMGTPILFNCATGLFNLEYLASTIDTIIEKLPLRFSNQDKDAGKYSQAEQVTWEIMGILDDFLVLAVNKYDRFLAAKMLVEGILTSGIRLDAKVFETSDTLKNLKELAVNLNHGLTSTLTQYYGLTQNGQKWTCQTTANLKNSLHRQPDRKP